MPPFRPNRPFRPRRAPFRPQPLAGPLAAQLREAQRLLEAGQPQAAAARFAELAQQAGHDGQFRRAVQLHLRASEIYADLRDGDRALAEARAGLAWLRRVGREARAGRLGGRIVEGLRAAGLTAPAAALAQELGEDEPAPAAPPAPGRLPARCSQCGAPVRSDEVEWIDAHSAECPYCGSTLPTLD